MENKYIFACVKNWTHALDLHQGFGFLQPARLYPPRLIFQAITPDAWNLSRQTLPLISEVEIVKPKSRSRHLGLLLLVSGSKLTLAKTKNSPNLWRQRLTWRPGPKPQLQLSFLLAVLVLDPNYGSNGWRANYLHDVDLSCLRRC